MWFQFAVVHDFHGRSVGYAAANFAFMSAIHFMPSSFELVG
jgi:hypothetical protein